MKYYVFGKKSDFNSKNITLIAYKHILHNIIDNLYNYFTNQVVIDSVITKETTLTLFRPFPIPTHPPSTPKI